MNPIDIHIDINDEFVRAYALYRGWTLAADGPVPPEMIAAARNAVAAEARRAAGKLIRSTIDIVETRTAARAAADRALVAGDMEVDDTCERCGCAADADDPIIQAGEHRYHRTCARVVGAR